MSFVDQDMFMRYRGGGVGHLATREYLQQFELDAGRDQIVLPKYDENGELEDPVEAEADSDDSESELEVDREVIEKEEGLEEMDSDSSEEDDYELEIMDDY